MQDGLVEHNKQEVAGRFILESITLQEAACVMTNLDAKKISRLVSRKDPVPDDIKQASLKSTIVSGVKKYFRDEVVSDLNPYTQDDTLQKIMNVIDQDVQIADKLKDKFKNIYCSDNVAEFLSETFLYCLLNIPWWRSHPIHENRATESICTEPCNPLLRATKSIKRATSNYEMTLIFII